MPDDRDETLLELARRVAGSSRAGEEVEAYVMRARDTDVKVFGGEVESLSVAEVAGVGVRVINGGRQGYAWAGSLDADVVTETVREARDNAEFAQYDEHLALATPQDFAGVPTLSLDLWRDELVRFPTDEKVRIALEVEKIAKSRDARIRGIEHAQYGDVSSEAVIVTSTGIESEARRTACSVYVVAIAGEAAQTQTGYGFSVGRAPQQLDLDIAAQMATDRAVGLLGAAQPRSARLPVVFDPMATSSIVGIIGAALNGDSALRGRTFLTGRLGEEIASSAVTLVDDPTNADAFAASTHDSEGVPTRRNVLVEDGLLRMFLHNVYSARRAGVATTGSAVRGGFKSTPGVGARALHLQPGTRDRDAVIGDVADGVYVQSVSGLHSGVNVVSGDFSVGAEGFEIRNGQCGAPLREMTIASTLPRILLDVAEVGSDLTWLPGGAAGMTIRIDGMSIGGR